MTQFLYKAITAAGEVQKGMAEAADQFALAKDLAASNLSLVSAESSAQSIGGIGLFLSRVRSLFGRVALSEKIIFARNLAAMVDAGLPLSRGLSVLERQARSTRFKNIIATISDEVRRGKQLSDGLAQFPETFSGLFVAMVRAGEEGGRLSESLRTVGIHMEQSYQLARKIRGAMMYPAIVVGAIGIVGVLMLTFVVPTLTQTFKELKIDLPLSTRAIITLSDILSSYGLIVLPVVLLCGVGIVFFFRSPRGIQMSSSAVVRLPLIGTLVKEVNTARTARTFSSLLTSGVSVVAALGITRDVLQNTEYKTVITMAEEKIQKGETIAGAFASNERLYPPMVGEMIAVGEETGQLPAMLLQIATFFENEVEQQTKDLSTIVEPILMVVIGIVVGFFAVSMISPMYSLGSGL